MSFGVETNESHCHLFTYDVSYKRPVKEDFKLRYEKVTGDEKLFAIAPLLLKDKLVYFIKFVFQ